MSSSEMYNESILNSWIICEVLTDANSVNFLPNVHINSVISLFGLMRYESGIAWGRVLR